MVGSKAHSYATESRHKSATLLEMHVPSHFNPAESLLPEVNASIGGVQGGGGSQTTFLKDILIALKGATIQYKNPNDTTPKSYVVGEILVESAAKATEVEKKAKEEEATKDASLKQKRIGDPIRQDAMMKIDKINTFITNYPSIKALKKSLRSAVYHCPEKDTEQVTKLVSLLPNINSDKANQINVAYSVSDKVGKKDTLINVIIGILEKKE